MEAGVGESDIVAAEQGYLAGRSVVLPADLASQALGLVPVLLDVPRPGLVRTGNGSVTRVPPLQLLAQHLDNRLVALLAARCGPGALQGFHAADQGSVLPSCELG